MKIIIDLPIDAYYHTQKKNTSKIDIDIILEAIRKGVPLFNVLESIKIDIDKLDFDFGDFYDHTESIHEMIDEVWNKHISMENYNAE